MSEIELQVEPGRGMTIGRSLIVLAAVLWSTSGWFVRNSAFASWPAEDQGLLFAFWRAAFAGLLLLPMARGIRFRPRLVPMMVCFVVMNVTFLSSMAQTNPGNTIWLQHTAPAWVLMLGLVFVRERVMWQDLAMLAFGVCGVVTILAFEIQGNEREGVVLGVLSGVTFAGVMMFVRGLRGENPIWLISLNLLATAAVLGPYLAVRGIWQTPDLNQALLLACFGLFQMGLPYVLFAHGSRTVRSQEASALVLLEPLLVPVWVYLAYSDVPKWWTMVGGGLIFLGLAVRYLPALFRPTTKR